MTSPETCGVLVAARVFALCLNLYRATMHRLLIIVVADLTEPNRPASQLTIPLLLYAIRPTCKFSRLMVRSDAACVIA